MSNQMVPIEVTSIDTTINVPAPNYDIDNNTDANEVEQIEAIPTDLPLDAPPPTYETTDDANVTSQKSNTTTLLPMIPTPQAQEQPSQQSQPVYKEKSCLSICCILLLVAGMVGFFIYLIVRAAMAG